MIDLEKFNISYFNNTMSKCSEVITLNKYVNLVRYGNTKEHVNKARECRGDKKAYRAIKSKIPCVTASCTVKVGKSHKHENIEDLNGVMVIDIDDELSDEKISELKSDRYTMILNRSISGDGVCIFVQVPQREDRFRISFEELAEYYINKYDVIIDPACKNVNRLRYISYDENIFVNLEAKKFNPSRRKEKKVPVVENFVFLQSDFDDIVRQITSRRLSICNSYEEYRNVGFAIADKFGASGLGYFKAIASCSDKYDDRHAEKQYKHCLSGGGITIATLYYYAKEAGCKLYSERTIDIVRSTSICRQGKKRLKNTTQHALDALDAKGIEVTDEEKELVETIFNSEKDFLKEVSDGESNIEKLINYINESYDLCYNEIRNTVYCNDHVLQDIDLNDMYIGASKLFNEDFKVSKQDILNILNSNEIRRYNPIAEFFDIDMNDIEEGYIDKYAKLLPYASDKQLEYNTWALKKYLVGAIHNWTCSMYDMEVCPFCLVLIGEHGNGKSSFIRNMLPPSLRNDYFLEEKIDSTKKDSKIKLGQYLLLTDEEFGGTGTKDAKAFKALADMRIINERLPYMAKTDTWKRRAILAATANEVQILKDFTGNRRIIPINTMCGKIDYEGVIDFDTVSMLYEAYKLYKDGFEWRIFTRKEQEYLKSNNEEFELAEPFGDVFFKNFSLQENESNIYERVRNCGEIINWFGVNTTLKPTKYDIRDMFEKRGIKATSVYRVAGKMVRGYKLYGDYKSDGKQF